MATTVSIRGDRESKTRTFDLRVAALATAILLLVGRVGLAKQNAADVQPLTHNHAHNDYEHTRPLFDALDQGFTSVEADIYLKNGQLLVGHTAASLRPERTLEKLYLDPLRERARANRGRIYRDAPYFCLLIDVKTAAGPTYKRLNEVLSQYSDLLTEFRDGKIKRKAVTAIVSGNRDKAAMSAQLVRYAALDGRPADLEGHDPADLIPWISESWGTLFHWKGDGPMPPDERARLLEMVKKAHDQRRMLRFWATPEKEAFWQELYADDVDLINTDKLAELAAFLRKQQQKK